MQPQYYSEQQRQQRVIYAQPGQTVVVPAVVREEQYFGPISLLSCLGLGLFFGPFGLLVCCCPCDRRQTGLVHERQMVVDSNGNLVPVVVAAAAGETTTMYGRAPRAQAMEPMMPERRAAAATPTVTGMPMTGAPVLPEGTNAHYYPKV
jgi:hypothetical protein